MPVARSQADIVTEWHDILGSYRDNADKLGLATAEPLRAALEESLLRVKELKSLQLHYIGLKQRTTQELREETKIGRERARCLRSAVRAVMGTDNEQLVVFRVAPIRKRGGRKRKKTETPEGGPESSGSEE
jgi:hypothetical protein